MEKVYDFCADERSGNFSAASMDDAIEKIRASAREFPRGDVELEVSIWGRALYEKQEIILTFATYDDLQDWMTDNAWHQYPPA